jgi:hypothetical protein
VDTLKSSNPAYNPFIHASVQPQRHETVNDKSTNPSVSSSVQPKRREIVNVKSTNPSDLNRDQRDAAEKAERQRNAPRRNAPIPEEEDSSNTDGETSWLYEDKLLPEQKSQILKLTTAIKCIKSKTYSFGYLKDKEEAIVAAEQDRLAGLIGPTYLSGVKFPWPPDRGQAPIYYDAHQVDRLKSRIESIKNSNAVMCQLEYTANKGGLGGQARSYVQLTDIALGHSTTLHTKLISTFY